MAIKYTKNASGYCYKVQGNTKVRISLEEYKKKTKKSKKTGGQYDTIHESNLPQSPTKKINKCASETCNRCPDLTSRISCMSSCANK